MASDIKSTQMKISWTPPDFDGGTPITGYQLEYKTKTGANWKKYFKIPTNTTATVVKGLNENTEYEFRIYVENEVGVSDESTAIGGTKTIGKFMASMK